MTTAKRELDPVLRAELLQGFAPSLVILAMLFPPIVTFAAGAMNYWISGHPSSGHSEGILVVSALSVAPIPALWSVRRRVVAVHGRYMPPLAYSVLSQIQLQWLLLLAWYSTPWVAAGVMLIYIFTVRHDIQYFFDDILLRWLYAAAPIAMLALLSLLDVAGGWGLRTRMADAPTGMLGVIWLLVSVAIICQVIIHWSGRALRLAHEQRMAWSHQQAEQARKQQERQTLQRSATIMGHGLTASKFSHDVASPLTVIKMISQELRYAESNSDIDEMLEDLHEAVELLTGLTRTMATSIRRPTDAQHVSIQELLQEAHALAKATIKSHDRSLAPLQVHHDPGVVIATPGHASTIANLLVNATLQTTPRIDIQGRRKNNETYELILRDHGVDEDDRPAALKRIHQSMQMDTTGDSATPLARDGVYRGYGISLHLARLLILRTGGWIEAQAPPEGAGVQFVLELPLYSPTTTSDHGAIK